MSVTVLDFMLVTKYSLIITEYQSMEEDLIFVGESITEMSCHRLNKYIHV